MAYRPKAEQATTLEDLQGSFDPLPKKQILGLLEGKTESHSNCKKVAEMSGYPKIWHFVVNQHFKGNDQGTRYLIRNRSLFFVGGGGLGEGLFLGGEGVISLLEVKGNQIPRSHSKVQIWLLRPEPIFRSVSNQLNVSLLCLWKNRGAASFHLQGFSYY